MEKHKIVIYPIAQNDLIEIVDYLNALSPDIAAKYYDLLLEQIGSLAELPERCPLVKDAQLRLRGYRTLLVKNHIVFYVIIDKTVALCGVADAVRIYFDRAGITEAIGENAYYWSADQAIMELLEEEGA